MTAAIMAAIVVAAVTVTATAVGSKEFGSNSDCRGHRQQSTIIGSKDTVAVATAIETAAAGTAMTAAGAPTTAPGICANVIAFATTWEGCGCWLYHSCVGLCVLVVCVLCAPVVLLGSHTYVHQKIGKPWYIWDCRKGLNETSQTITFN
jgi:hypothetical protein